MNKSYFINLVKYIIRFYKKTAKTVENLQKKEKNYKNHK